MRLAESVCAAAFVATLVACDKPTDPPFGDPAATATAPVNATATADGSATPTTAPSSPARSAPSHPAPSASAAAAQPLADWMRGPPTTAILAGYLESIALSFEQIARWALAHPADYPNWASISIDGSRAARMGNVEAAKAACRGCHAQYEARYKAELGARPLPRTP